jgi:hypothetical protein
LKHRFRVKSDKPLAVHFTDGEWHQLEAVFRQMENGDVSLIACKSNASRSAVDQLEACDQHFFLCIQRSNAHQKFADRDPFNDGKVEKQVKAKLKEAAEKGVTSLNDAKIATIARAFQRLPYILQHATNMTTISGSFKDVGMGPISFKLMARQNTPGWFSPDLSIQQKVAIFRELPAVCLMYYLTGRIEEEDFDLADCPSDICTRQTATTSARF